MRYLISLVVLAAPLFAQETRTDRPDLTIISRIKTEAFEKSQVMDTLGYLTDAYGPRLTASPEFREAADWVVKRLQSYGVQDAHLERWGPFGRSWSLKQYALEMIEPRYALLDAAPLAWSDSTPSSVSGEIVIAPFAGGRPTLDPARLEAEQNRYFNEWKGKLRGKIVLLAPLREIRPETQPRFERYTDPQLAGLALAPAPLATRSDVSDLRFPDDPDEARRFNQSLPSYVREQFARQRERLAVKRAQFFRNEGALALINTSDTSRDGLVFAQSAGSYDEKDPLALPTFVVTREQYNRMARLLEKKIAVKVRASLQADISKTNQDSYNVTGEIPGGAKKDELIMIGAHLDSWHSGTGATDNGAGSAVMIEVMRILKALNLKLDRTVRIALWSGEEEGLLGSKAYVKEHFGDPGTMKLTAAHARLSGYFNLDNGSGKNSRRLPARQRRHAAHFRAMARALP